MRVAALGSTAALCAVLALTGCSGNGVAGLTAPDDQGTNPDPAQVDAVQTPQIDACRVLTPEDVAQPSNATETIDCADPHTARTYAVGQLPARFDDAEYADPRLSSFAYQTCGKKFREYIGADESIAMRTILNWAWFRPSQDAWSDGARWYRCDVVGGGAQSEEYVDLPEDTKGVLLGRPPNELMVCAVGPTIAGSRKVPCSEEHDWRAISTVQLGKATDTYPGERVIEVRTRDFCSDQVGAYLEYPVDYDFGYTWFHEAEWEAGSRRSVCWAKTDA